MVCASVRDLRMICSVLLHRGLQMMGCPDLGVFVMPCLKQGYYFFCFFWFGIRTASVPSTAETLTGGGAVLGKPESGPARRDSRNIVLK